MLRIRDVEGPKKTGSVETSLEAMEQQVFKCQGMVERGLNANHNMITEFTSNHKMDAIDIGKHLSRLYDRVDQLQGQIYDLQNQNCGLRRHPLAEYKVAFPVLFGFLQLRKYGQLQLCQGAGEAGPAWRFWEPGAKLNPGGP
ncbi:40S ribosomal protein S5-1 [Hordeum vulgare]|nr:40S ribosomal protein S5-1 [Hordeum vulgare]